MTPLQQVSCRLVLGANDFGREWAPTFNQRSTDIDNKNTAAILAMPKITAVSYSRPIDPIVRGEESSAEEKAIARTVQFHKCNAATCLRNVKGRLECKRGAPFAVSPVEWINEDGEWGPK